MAKSKRTSTPSRKPKARFRRSAAPVPVRAVDFIMYRAKKPLQTRAWYQELFGFKKGEEWHAGWSEFATEPISVCLDGPPFDDESIALHGGGAVAFAVDDIHAAAAELKKRRVKIVRGPIETRVCWMLFIRDPEGNNLVIHQRKNGTAG